jgi:alkanesulfonate monooxygenase SsuD/methylene tetrahydromethanopterin reductase-like flavin-dependent oxidoreductase (luciferase family)
MRSGFALLALNYEDWEERYEASDFSRPPTTPDGEVWDRILKLADLVEPLGFDSLWAPEHHTTPYCQTPNPLLVLSYMASRTSRLDFGTMVLVLPWHHPFQVAGEIALLSSLLRGRHLTIGMGRGLSGREFGAFSIDQSEARDRYIESVEIIRRAFAHQQFSYDGKFFQIPLTQLRPHIELDRVELLGSFGSPSSLPVVANLDLGMLFVAGQTPDQISQNVQDFNDIRAQRGLEANRPRVVFWMYCSESESEIEEGVECAVRFAREAGGHYQFTDPANAARFANIKGYEDYAAGRGTGSGGLPSVADARIGHRANQIIGTPDECIEKIRRFQAMTEAQEFVYICQFGDMPMAMAERSMRLFADQVMPVARRIPVGKVPARQASR